MSFLIYILIFVLSISFMEIYSALSSYRNKYIKIVFYLLIILPPSILASVRTGVGTDFYSYQYVFQLAVNNFQTNNFIQAYNNTEPLYVMLEYISFLIQGDNFHFFLLLTSLLTLLPVVSFIMNEIPRNYKSFSLFIYLFIFYLVSYNIIRQMLAVSIVIYSFKYIMSKNVKKYILCIIIATLFHNSAIIALLFYYLNVEISLNKKMKIYQLIILFIVLSIPLIYFLMTRFGSSLPIIGSYFENYRNVQNKSNIYFILFTVLPVLPALLNRNQIILNENGNKIYNITLITIIFALLGIMNDWAFRLMYYSTSVIIIVYPLLLNKLNKVNRYLYTAFLIVFFLSVFYVTFVKFGFNDVIPYEYVPINSLFL